jgi:hypothetical protein
MPIIIFSPISFLPPVERFFPSTFFFLLPLHYFFDQVTRRLFFTLIAFFAFQPPLISAAFFAISMPFSRYFLRYFHALRRLLLFAASAARSRSLSRRHFPLPLRYFDFLRFHAIFHFTPGFIAR